MRTPWIIPVDAPTGASELPIHSPQVPYDTNYGAAVASPLYHIQTQGDTIGDTIGETGLPVVNVDIRRTIDQTVGGTPGVMNKQGYTSGIQYSWQAQRFHGGAVELVRRDLAGDTGPVGVSNRAGVLKSAVESQYTVPPTMEQIYASIIGGR